MATTTLLAGDMGGTKTLLALYGSEEGQLSLLHQERFRSGEWSSLEPILEAFLNNRPADLPAPTHACIAVAGPVQHKEARITNLPWRLREADLAWAAGTERLELVNDFRGGGWIFFAARNQWQHQRCCRRQQHNQ